MANQWQQFLCLFLKYILIFISFTNKQCGAEFFNDELTPLARQPARNQISDETLSEQMSQPVDHSDAGCHQSEAKKPTPKPAFGGQELSNDLSTPTLDPGSVSSSLSFIKFAEALQAANLKKFGDDFDDRSANKLKHNFELENEDKYLNSRQLIAKCGYPIEEYTVVTSDGYLLNVIHIPGNGQPVLIMHGLLDSSDGYVTSGCENSLAFVVSDAGYDVWLANARGNRYSRNHVSLNPDTDEIFWNFDWDTIGRIDLAAAIDFILEKTDEKKIFYIGHSQGTTTPFVLLSEKPEYNDKIILLVTLSPVAWMSHAFSPFLKALSQFVEDEQFITQAIGLGEFIPGYEFGNIVKSIACGTSAVAATACNPLLSSIYGFDREQVDYKQYPVQVSHLIAGSSTRQLLHFAQLFKSSKFRKYDHGEEENMIRYGRPTPPDYDVTKVTCDVAMFASANDWLSSLTDVAILKSKLPNVKFYHEEPDFDHLAFLWGKDVYSRVYSKVIDHMNEYLETDY